MTPHAHAAPPVSIPLSPLDTFAHRHMGLSDADIQAMLDAIGVGSVEALIEQTVPKDIRLERPLSLVGLDGDGSGGAVAPLGEAECLERLHEIASRNQMFTSMIGMGYYGTITPPVILRNVLENPKWYTPYTPYQAEISQGRLEALLNFQTMVCDLTGLPLAGASLLDEATAAAEAMAMCHSIARQKKGKFFVAQDCHPQTIAVVKTRAGGLGIEVVVGQADGSLSAGLASGDFSGILLQYPATDGRIEDYSALAAQAHEHGALVVAATDLLACCLIVPPGEWGADIAVGSSQRFGVPMGYGGPHAAFLATKDEYARKMPGRLIGVSKDVHGDLAYRMAIQTREQHIKRDKATSNICTAQALLAIVAGFYAVYHGPEGLKAIAQRVQRLTRLTAEGFRRAFEAGGVSARVVNPDACFDTITIELAGRDCALEALKGARALNINLRDFGDHRVGISLDETTTIADVRALWQITGTTFSDADESEMLDALASQSDPPFAIRHSPFLTHPVFSRYHTEHELLRYATRMISKDYGLAHGMIPLGSCTMKLNAAVEMIPITWPTFANMHPFCPPEQARGYRKLFDDLEAWLGEITGFAAVSLQPNAGSQGEYAGLMCIQAYHAANEVENRKSERGSRSADGKTDSPSLASGHPPSPIPHSPSRTKCLIPTSAHGTNPASAVIAGMSVVPIACRANGDIDIDDLRKKAEQHRDTLSCLMITYPSTHGVFEDTIREACQIVHDNGGQVYMDGANMNAQVGYTSPGQIGADVCHLNLHKTFCIPHGGGGPGMGPIGVAEHLKGFLPTHPVLWNDEAPDPDDEASDARGFVISAAPYGSPMILPISWVYIALMGSRGLRTATERAILNANYMAWRLRGHYDVLYTGPSGTVAHEFIVDCRPFEKAAQVTVDDIAKRLMDYGFHAPTMSWPVAGTLMIEPTESESKAELDRFCEAMIGIREEIRRIEAGEWPQDDNPLKGAPHTAEHVTGDDWAHAYPRQVAAYPVGSLREPGRKFWPSVGRIDNPYGDRHLICTCPPIETYGENVE